MDESDGAQPHEQLLSDQQDGNFAPIPFQNTWGLLFFELNLKNITPKWALRALAIMLCLLNITIQVLFLYIVRFKMVEFSEDETVFDLEWWVRAPCLFMFFMAMILSAKHGWLLSMSICFCRGRESWPGQPPMPFEKLRNKWFCFFCASVPEMLLWMYTIWIGTAFLTLSKSAEEIMLNSLALVFINEVDEAIFKAATPAMIINLWHVLEVDKYWLSAGSKVETATLSYKEVALMAFEMALLVPGALLVAMLISVYPEYLFEA